jgi:hypothetical protein
VIAYLEHFGLSQPPFSKEIEDTDLWLPPSKQGLVDELVETVEEHASACLVGDPGVGKTSVLRALRQRLPQAGFRLTYLPQCDFGAPRLLSTPVPRPRHHRRVRLGLRIPRGHRLRRRPVPRSCPPRLSARRSASRAAGHARTPARLAQLRVGSKGADCPSSRTACR